MGEEGGIKKKKRHYSLEHYKLTNVTNLGWRKIKRKNKGNKGGKDCLMNMRGGITNVKGRSLN